MDSNKLKLRLDDISEVNPALTCYHRDEPAPDYSARSRRSAFILAQAQEERELEVSCNTLSLPPVVERFSGW